MECDAGAAQRDRQRATKSSRMGGIEKKRAR